MRPRLSWRYGLRMLSGMSKLTTRQRELIRLRRLCATGEAKRIRLRAGASQPQVGREIRRPASTVSRWENGQRQPRGDSALRYLRVLDELATIADDVDTSEAGL